MAREPAKAQWFEVTTLGELEDKVREEENVLVKFYTTVCGPCREYHKFLDGYAWEGDVAIVSIDARKAERGILERYPFTSVPHTVAFHRGEATGEQRGFPKDEGVFRAFVERAFAEKGPRPEPQ